MAPRIPRDITMIHITMAGAATVDWESVGSAPFSGTITTDSTMTIMRSQARMMASSTSILPSTVHPASAACAAGLPIAAWPHMVDLDTGVDSDMGAGSGTAAGSDVAEPLMIAPRPPVVAATSE